MNPGTPEERVRLLKKGVKYKTIEDIYIKHNGLKVINSPILFDFIETSFEDSDEIPVIELKKTGNKGGDMSSMSSLADAY